MTTSLPLGSHRRSWQAPLLGVILIAILGGAAYLLSLSWPLLFPKPVFRATAPAECDLRASACTAAFDESRFIRLDLEPKTLRATRPLSVAIETAGFPVDTVSIEFSGVNMDMGLIKNELVDIGVGSFAGETILPVCVRRQMSWQAMVTATGPDNVHQATFGFEVFRN